MQTAKTEAANIQEIVMSGRDTPRLVIFDTEYTTWKTARESRWQGRGQHREVIQIAGIKLTKGQPWQEAPTFEVLTKPVLNPVLNEETKALTGITQERMDAEGVTMSHGLRLYREFADDVTSVSNGNDINVMAETCGLQGIFMPLEPKRFDTIRPELYAALKEEVGEFDQKEYPSGRVHELLGITLPTSQVHNALHDVFALAAVSQELERRGYRILPW